MIQQALHNYTYQMSLNELGWIVSNFWMTLNDMSSHVDAKWYVI